MPRAALVDLRTEPRGDLPGECAVAEADRAGRKAAAAACRDTLGGFRIGDVGQQVGAVTASILDVDPSFLDALAGPEALDRYLLAADVRAPRVRLILGPDGDPPWAAAAVRSEEDVDSHRAFEVDALGLVEGLRAGGTAIVNDIGHRVPGVLGWFTDDLSRSIGSAAVWTNTYLSERDAVGFGRHWDDHDVLIIQCAGTKQWDLFEPPELSPVKGWIDEKASGPASMTAILEPGMGLYIPRGWPHAVTGFVGDLSMHLTVSIGRLTTRHLLQAATKREGLDRVVDQDQPRLPSMPLVGSVLDHHRAQWRSEQESSVRTGPIEWFRARRAGWRGWELRMAAPAGVVFVDDGDARASVTRFVLNQRVVSLPTSSLGPVLQLLTGPVRIEALVTAAAASGDEVMSLVNALADGGCLDIRRVAP